MPTSVGFFVMIEPVKLKELHRDLLAENPHPYYFNPTCPYVKFPTALTYADYYDTPELDRIREWLAANVEDEYLFVTRTRMWYQPFSLMLDYQMEDVGAALGVMFWDEAESIMFKLVLSWLLEP